MMPPNCCLCPKGIETDDVCELITFRKTDDDHQSDNEHSVSEKLPDHPTEMEWFCEDHQATAQAYIDCTKIDAINQIRKNEQWHLIQLDLFDRDTPPSCPVSGIGFESGFSTYIEHAVTTINEVGECYPDQYRISFGDPLPDFAVNGEGVFEIDRRHPTLLSIKVMLAGQDSRKRKLCQLAQGFANAMRQNSSPQKRKFLTKLADSCQIRETGEKIELLTDQIK